MKYIEGGVCAPKGFKASGVHCGIRKNREKRDVALVYSEVDASVGAVYTTNLVKGSPLIVTKNNLKGGVARAIICNSGNANTCNANGVQLATDTCKLLAENLDIDYKKVIVASTGVIGQPMTIEPFEVGIPQLVKELDVIGGDNASEAIMTTDTVQKQVAVQFELDGVTCKIGGMAKGSGMIHPNMATMLVFLTSDINITSEMLQKALKSDVQDTFNMISIDGDTSTNDMVAVMANGLSGNKIIDKETEAYETFKKALNAVTEKLCKMIAKDGEGATKLIECEVNGGKTESQAKKIAKSVICSSLVKCAMFGADANWGRVLCAIGYSGEQVDVNAIDVYFKSKKGEIAVAKNGASLEFSEEKAKEILLEDEIVIRVELKEGKSRAKAFGCDLTYDYVRINGDYRT